MEIFFVSSNEGKRAEVRKLLETEKIKVNEVNREIIEIQHTDICKIAEEKVIQAFKTIWRPVLVEQTGLYLTNFGGMPGGLTRIFWDALGAEKFSSFFSGPVMGEAVARSVFAYCNGKSISIFSGTMEGHIVAPRGENSFGWDCVFQPRGFSVTLAEMKSEKNKYSMRKEALEKVKFHLEEEMK